jgi:hypothetical protein
MNTSRYLGRSSCFLKKGLNKVFESRVVICQANFGIFFSTSFALVGTFATQGLNLIVSEASRISELL